MWRLLAWLGTRRLADEFRRNLDRGIDRLQQISVGVVFAQAGLLFVVFASGFALVALFFHLAEQSVYVGPGLVTALAALLPALVLFFVAGRLFRRG